jgi:hypothetical protein
MRQLPFRSQPSEHPIQHAEKKHRNRLVQRGALDVGSHKSDGVGERLNDVSLFVEDAITGSPGEKSDVLGQHPVKVLRLGVFGQEARDESLEPRRWRNRRIVLTISQSCTKADTCRSAMLPSSSLLST